jgi:ribosomal protein L37AE/L43A
LKKALLLLLVGALAFVGFAVLSAAFDSNDRGGNGGGGGLDFLDIASLLGLIGWLGIPGGIVVIIIIIVLVMARKKVGSALSGGVRPSSTQGLHITLPDRTAQIENIIKQSDPNFSTNDFISFAKNVYLDIQTAWCKRDLVPVRPVLHDNLYNTTARQIQAKIDQGVIFHYESIAINTAYLTSYIKDTQFEYVTIYLNARMIDWEEDEKTGKVLRGDKTTRWDLRYTMKFMRSAGVTTKEEVAKAQGHNCPNCGAPMEISSSGNCVYCNSVVTTGQYSWVLSDFGTIRNDTRDEGIRNN